MKAVIFHQAARLTLKRFPADVRLEFGKLIFEVQCGANLSFPASRPMPSVAFGVEELRVRDANGTYRVFYYKKSASGILVFHAFVKKTQKTPPKEIDLAQKRLRELQT